MPTKITERTGARIVLPEAKGDKYKVRLMGWEPGAKVVEGSSADYPVSQIKDDFPTTFPKGTRMRANHDGLCEAGGDVRRIMAKTVDTPWPEEDGMYAHMLVPDEYASFVESFGDVIGLSISAGCEIEMEAATDEDGEPITDHEGHPVMQPRRSERGALIVKRFLSQEESPYNSVDFVEAPGADGAIVARAVQEAKHAMEGFTIREAATFAKGTIKTEEDSTATPPRSNKKEHIMTPEEAQAIAEAAALAAVTAYAEAHPTVESAPSEQPTLAVTVEAVTTAGLTEAGRAEVYARIERGETVEAAVAAEVAREASIEAEVQRRVEAASATSQRVLDFGFTEDEGKPGVLGQHAKEGATPDKAKTNEAFDNLLSGVESAELQEV